MSDTHAESASDAHGHAHTHERRLVDRPDAPADDGWTLEPHICRSCFSRLVSKAGDAPGWRLYQCTNCGLNASGQAPAAICSCGTKIRKPTASGRSGSVMGDAGIRCHANPSPTPEFPSLFVASEMSYQAAK
jgi:hypothetical protein